MPKSDYARVAPPEIGPVLRAFVADHTLAPNEPPAPDFMAAWEGFRETRDTRFLNRVLDPPTWPRTPEASGGALYVLYVEAAREAGLFPAREQRRGDPPEPILSGRDFGLALVELGFPKRETNSANMYPGLSLLTASERYRARDTGAERVHAYIRIGRGVNREHMETVPHDPYLVRGELVPQEGPCRRESHKDDIENEIDRRIRAWHDHAYEDCGDPDCELRPVAD